MYTISAFRRDVYEICAFVLYAAQYHSKAQTSKTYIFLN